MHNCPHCKTNGDWKMCHIKWINWSRWSDGGMVNFGQMPSTDVEKNLQKFKKEAARLLEKSGADHVVYGLKTYDDNDELESVRFYMHPMGDAEFQKDVATLAKCVVYALHKR